MHPVIREIVGGASRFTAADAFAAFDRLATLHVDAERAWDGLDAIVMPTSATTATVDALEADPIRVNARFGYYTNFVNLLDLSAIAVVGAHLRGEPLNWQLTQRGARFVAATTTAAAYRLHALPAAAAGGVAKPGLVRVAEGGAAIAVELWALPVAAYGSFVAGIAAPLGIGTLTLADGTQVQGFLCESAALDGAEDITRFGGWRAYRTHGAHATRHGDSHVNDTQHG